MKPLDQLSGLFWLAIAIFVCVESAQVGIGAFQTPGSGFLAFWSGVILGTFAILLIITSSLRKKEKEKTTDVRKGVMWSKVIFVLITLYTYTALLPLLGYLLATFGLMAFLFGIIGRRRIWFQIAGALITVLVTYVIFYRWLDVQLPKGIFSF